MSSALTTMETTVLSYQKSFDEVNAYKLNFRKEATFALQLLKSNDFLRETAQGNQDSLQNAITNIAAIGISLNPALKEAYLVPRDKKVCLDISYIGLIKLATDTGSVIWVQAETVRVKDDFTFNGVGQAPTHKMDPFKDRGEIVGVYCVAKLATGEFLCTVMSAAECNQIRDKSSKAAQKGPWKDFHEEMMKKTVIKRASKLWPKSERLDTAVEVLNQHEGIDFNSRNNPHVDESAKTKFIPTPEIFADLRKKLEAQDKSEPRLVAYVNTHFKIPVENPFTSIDQFESEHIEYAYRLIGEAA